MSYLDRLKAQFPEKPLAPPLSKLPKAPYDSFDSDQGRPFPEIESSAPTSAPPPLWWRVAILDPGGRTVEVDSPSGLALADWQAYVEQYHGPGCTVTPIAELPKPRAPVNLDEALAAACEAVAGITPEVFRSLLSPEDIEDIAAGGIHRKTLRAYALSFAEGIRAGRIKVLPKRVRATD